MTAHPPLHPCRQRCAGHDVIDDLPATAAKLAQFIHAALHRLSPEDGLRRVAVMEASHAEAMARRRHFAHLR